MFEEPVAVVAAWQEAVNNQDRDALVRLSDPAIEIVGPRGVARGHVVLLEWLDRAGIQLETVAVYARDAVVVVAQRASWRDGGAVVGEATVASRFEVNEGRVTHYARYDDLDTALSSIKRKA
jgi:limonene-1,2-epoxide hydrolase